MISNHNNIIPPITMTTVELIKDLIVILYPKSLNLLGSLNPMNNPTIAIANSIRAIVNVILSRIIFLL